MYQVLNMRLNKKRIVLRGLFCLLVVQLSVCSFGESISTMEMNARLERMDQDIEFYYEKNRMINELLNKKVIDMNQEELLSLAECYLLDSQPENAQEILSILEEKTNSMSGEEAGNFVNKKNILLEINKQRALGYLIIAQQVECNSLKLFSGCKNKSSALTESPADKAITAYLEVLKQEPQNIVARWLLNMALNLTTRNYIIDSTLKIDQNKFSSDIEFKIFDDVAALAKVNTRERAGGSIFDDFNNDGHMDIITSSHALVDPIHYFEGRGDGTFVDSTEKARLKMVKNGLNIVQADYNNDGYLDFLLLRGGWTEDPIPNSLFRNNGDGTFSDVTEKSGLLAGSPTQTAAWADFDNDGFLDLLIGNEKYHSVAKENDQGVVEYEKDDSYSLQLFKNRGDGTFFDISISVGLKVPGMIKGVSWGDIDNDGLIDIYVSRMGEDNLLFRNEGLSLQTGSWHFADITVQSGIQGPLWSFPAWHWDYNNDGLLDIFVASMTGQLSDIINDYLQVSDSGQFIYLYKNLGNGKFVDVAKGTNIDVQLPVMGANYGDLDNDGYPDFYIGTGMPQLETMVPNLMFLNNQSGGFYDVTTSGGFGTLHKGHGVAFADMDHDGDQDILVNLGGFFDVDTAPNALFENPGFDNNWLTLRFIGSYSNRFGIGNRIKITTESKGIINIFYKHVSSGGSFGASSLQQEVGLGKADRITSVEIFWPASGVIQVFTDLQPNKTYEIREDRKEAKLIE